MCVGASLHIGEVCGVSIGGWFVCVDWEPVVNQTMQILQFQDKGTHLNIIEWFFIYAEFLKNSHLNDEHCISPNKIFDALLKPQPTINPTPTPSNTQAPL